MGTNFLKNDIKSFKTNLVWSDRKMFNVVGVLKYMGKECMYI